jgi:hypothetical protein
MVSSPVVVEAGFGGLAESVRGLAVAIGADLGVPGGSTASGAVLISFFAGGFLWGYLWCSLHVFREMSALVSREKAVARRESSTNSSGDHG